MITPRVTRLVRVGNLQAFREAAIALAIQGSPLEARDRLVIVPTRAAAEQLVRGIEDASASGRDSSGFRDFVRSSSGGSPIAFRSSRRELSAEEREVLLRVACRAVMAGGIEPPFRVRPGLVAEMVRFYDDLRRNQKDVDTFERLALGMLEPGAADDRGARQLVEQTRFLAAVFRRLRTTLLGTGRRRTRTAAADPRGSRSSAPIVMSSSRWRIALSIGTALRLSTGTCSLAHPESLNWTSW